jgi:hypothetical protein
MNTNFLEPTPSFMKSLRHRLLLSLCVFIFGLGMMTGSYGFGKAQIAVDVLVILIVFLWLICLMFSQTSVPQRHLSGEDKRKLAVLIHERVGTRKRKLKDFLRRIFHP